MKKLDKTKKMARFNGKYVQVLKLIWIVSALDGPMAAGSCCAFSDIAERPFSKKILRVAGSTRGFARGIYCSTVNSEKMRGGNPCGNGF